MFNFFGKQFQKHLGFFSPAFATSPQSFLAPGFKRQSGLGGQSSAAIFVFQQIAEKTRFTITNRCT
ncbi:hypothetical protein [uncultured Pedobacter sp.]|uniref:hypothetical protein n=1 Tax=uncultured Pedobacter sp. TaxID=246139 RepID=UPI0025ED2C1B|nr:hypothetical protein [uncultured Pedobacter sp.]